MIFLSFLLIYFHFTSLPLETIVLHPPALRPRKYLLLLCLFNSLFLSISGHTHSQFACFYPYLLKRINSRSLVWKLLRPHLPLHCLSLQWHLASGGAKFAGIERMTDCVASFSKMKSYLEEALSANQTGFRYFASALG